VPCALSKYYQHWQVVCFRLEDCFGEWAEQTDELAEAVVSLADDVFVACWAGNPHMARRIAYCVALVVNVEFVWDDVAEDSTFEGDDLVDVAVPEVRKKVAAAVADLVETVGIVDLVDEAC